MKDTSWFSSSENRSIANEMTDNIQKLVGGFHTVQSKGLLRAVRSIMGP